MAHRAAEDGDHPAPAARLTAGAGSYLLVLRAARRFGAAAGRLGGFDFPAGFYIYCGSARGPGGLRARVGRHVGRAGARHWHVDYLRPHVAVVCVLVCEGGARLECVWARALQRKPGMEPGAARFGASDCRCAGHLWRFRGRRNELLGVLAGLPGQPRLVKVRRGQGA